MVVIFVILIYIIIGCIEIIPMIKQKKKRELILYSPLFISAFVMSVLLSIGVKIPSPAEPIEKIVMTILGKQ